MALTPKTPAAIERALVSDKNSLIKQSFNWLVGRMYTLKSNTTIPGAINPSNYINNRLFGVGDVFLYHYDPKTKQKLPYYDKFPLTVIIQQYSDGFLGLNLHYLPYDIRIGFMNKLIKLGSTPLGDTKTRMQISYDLLKDSKRYAAYKPCVKRYLISYVRGRMMRITPMEWPLCIYVPIASFSKKPETYVWAESRRMIR